MDWINRFFFTQSACTVFLKPDETGKKGAGFHGGQILPCAATPGETLAAVLDRFNTYRGPDQQIVRVWSEAGSELDLATILKTNLVIIIRGQSFSGT
jgi:hypothetical protein